MKEMCDVANIRIHTECKQAKEMGYRVTVLLFVELTYSSIVLDRNGKNSGKTQHSSAFLH